MSPSKTRVRMQALKFQESSVIPSKQNPSNNEASKKTIERSAMCDINSFENLPEDVLSVHVKINDPSNTTNPSQPFNIFAFKRYIIASYGEIDNIKYLKTGGIINNMQNERTNEHLFKVQNL